MADITPIPPPDEPPDAAADSFVYASRPPTAGESLLREKFYERYADQSRLMDELARQMITVELAVPGLYASVLALLRGDKATLPAGPLLWLAFGGWGLALLLTFLAVFPRNYPVDTTLLEADPAAGGPLGIVDYFRRPARYKWRLLAAAAAAFWVGLAAGVWVLFVGK